MKIITVVGARPQFIKAAVVSKVLRKKHREVLIHTGQHYDKNMSDVFFDELEIPKPDYNLGINGGSHATMTAQMMIELEEKMLYEIPEMVLVYGDTNSTLAAALVAAKLKIPVCHVEAGARTYMMTNPEEINRICTDHISTLLLACTPKSQEALIKEDLADRARYVGDPMYDAFLKYLEISEQKAHELVSLGRDINVKIPLEYYYLTCHREENTTDEKALNEILFAANSLDAPTIYPVHPRNKKRALSICDRNNLTNVILVEPVGYLTSIFLTLHSKKIITDSGGLQREAFFAKKQCVTVLDFDVWPETMLGNRNQRAKADVKDIMNKLSKEQIIDEEYAPFGDGKAAYNIVECINQLES